MNKKKMVSFIIASAFLGTTLCITPASATVSSNTLKPVEQTSCNFEKVEDYAGYDTIDILGSKYDLSGIDTGVLLSIVRTFDKINSGSLSKEQVKDLLTQVKDILEGYKVDPSKYQNLPVTLEFGPANLLMDEVNCVQSKIEELKKEQDMIKKSRMAQQAIDEKVSELQSQIDTLTRWINYSIFNFKSDSYKQTLTSSNSNSSSSSNQQVTKRELMSAVYTSANFDKVFKVVINTDGSLSVGGAQVSKQELYDSVKNGLEYENLKARNILQQIEKVKQSKISKVEQDKRIAELSKELENVKAYSLGQEIALLNLEKQSLQLTKASAELISQNTERINKEIEARLIEINKHNSDASYVIENFRVGKSRSYFGYLLNDDSTGLSVKIGFDSQDKIVINDGEENFTLSDEQKQNIKKLIGEKIKESEKMVTSLKTKKAELETKEIDNKYYVLDSLDKNIALELNNIENYNLILSQI